MYRIGEFASMTELTKETLRYYADIKLLEPVYVDPDNHYKYYDNHSYLMARLLFHLRRFGFSIQEMKDFVEKRSLEDLEDILQEKKRKLSRQVEAINAIIKDIDSFMDEGNGGEK